MLIEYEEVCERETKDEGRRTKDEDRRSKKEPRNKENTTSISASPLEAGKNAFHPDESYLLKVETHLQREGVWPMPESAK